jgi:DnaJ domain
VPDPYEVLGVSEDASPDEVRSAFRVLVQIFHPDRFEGMSEGVRSEAVRRMQEVNWAYGELRGSGNTVYWETSEWTNRMRGDLTVALLDAGIPHRWDENELTVLLRYEEIVDEILDRHYGS